MKLDAVFFNLIPVVNRDVARLDLQLVSVSEACQYAESRHDIPSAVHSDAQQTTESWRETLCFCTSLLTSPLWLAFILL